MNYVVLTQQYEKRATLALTLLNNVTALVIILFITILSQYYRIVKFQMDAQARTPGGPLWSQEDGLGRDLVSLI